MVLVLGIVKTVREYWYWYWVLLRTPQKISIGYCEGLFGNIGYWYWGKESGIAHVWRAYNPCSTPTIQIFPIVCPVIHFLVAVLFLPLI